MFENGINMVWNKCKIHDAAPELLAFLEELIDGAKGEKPSPDDLLERAEKLFSKAKGQQK
jgi:hypothetical protein